MPASTRLLLPALAASVLMLIPATSIGESVLVHQGKAGAASGACPLFAGKQVAAAGWCSSWVKKTT